MPSCKNYFGKVFAHLAAALAISAASAETSNIGSTIYGNASVLKQFLGNLAIMLGLMFGVFLTRPGGVPKYAFFIAMIHSVALGWPRLYLFLKKSKTLGLIIAASNYIPLN